MIPAYTYTPSREWKPYYLPWISLCVDEKHRGKETILSYIPDGRLVMTDWLTERKMNMHNWLFIEITDKGALIGLVALWGRTNEEGKVTHYVFPLEGDLSINSYYFYADPNNKNWPFILKEALYSQGLKLEYYRNDALVVLMGAHSNLSVNSRVRRVINKMDNPSLRFYEEREYDPLKVVPLLPDWHTYCLETLNKGLAWEKDIVPWDYNGGEIALLTALSNVGELLIVNCEVDNVLMGIGYYWQKRGLHELVWLYSRRRSHPKFSIGHMLNLRAILSVSPAPLYFNLGYSYEETPDKAYNKKEFWDSEPGFNIHRVVPL